MRRITQKVIMTIIIFVFAIATEVSAAEAIKIVINGKEVNVETAPEVINGRTMVPLRAIFEALGANVEWNKDTKTAVAVNDEYEIRVALNSKNISRKEIATGQTKEIAIDQAPESRAGRILVPVRFVSEVMGNKVSWDKYSKSVIITDVDKVLEERFANLNILNEIIDAYAKPMDGLRENGKIELVANINEELYGTKKLGFKMDTDTQVTKEAINIEFSFEIIGDLTKIMTQLLGSAEKVEEFKLFTKPITGCIYIDREIVYLKSNFVELMPKLVEDANMSDSDKKIFNNLSKGVYIKMNQEQKEVFGEVFDEVSIVLEGKNNKERYIQTLQKLLDESYKMDFDNMTLGEVQVTLLMTEFVSDLCGDDKFTKSGNTYTYKIDKAILKKEMSKLVPKINNLINEELERIQKYNKVNNKNESSTISSASYTIDEMNNQVEQMFNYLTTFNAECIYNLDDRSQKSKINVKVGNFGENTQIPCTEIIVDFEGLSKVNGVNITKPNISDAMDITELSQNVY